MEGEYKEQLPIGYGKIVVTKEDYYIQFVFSISDKRYSSDYLIINKNDIDNYIEAFKVNWKKYLELKEKISIIGEQFTTIGLLGMKINVGLWNEGVCVYSFYKNLRTEDEINEMINSLLWAKVQGPKMMQVFNEN